MCRLRGCGEFTFISGIEPGSEVAINPNSQINEWILGRVIYYYPDLGAYDVADVDDCRKLKLPETQVKEWLIRYSWYFATLVYS